MSNISVDDVVVDETNKFAVFTVRLDVANALAVTVNYATAANTAAANVDYSHLVGSLTFAPGEIIKTVSVPIINDAAVEKVENFRLVLSAPSANAKISDNSAIASIIDNDAPAGVPVVSINDFVVDEASKEATFVITLNKPSTSVVSMNYATQNGSAVGGSDFTATSGSLNFAPGETAKTVKVTLVNDIVTEASEAFNLVLSAVTNATTLDPNGTAIIAENDAPKVLVSNISVEDIVVGESQVYADFLVRLDAPNTGTVTVNYATDANTAAANVDYSHLVGSLTFAAGEMVKTVRVTLADDAAVEKVENFRLVLSAPSANAKISDNSAIASIIDNDAPAGVPVVSINDFVVDEASKEATFVITLNKPSTSVVSMNYATQNGSAVGGSDFTATSGSLNFAPGETAKTVKVTLVNDIVTEASEAFNLVLSAVTNATTLDPNGTAIIAENDAPKVLVSNISVEDIVVGESQVYADFLVRLDAPNTGTVTVNYATDANTAAANVDYSHLVGSLTFAAGEMVKTVRVTLADDAAVEKVENFRLVLSAPSANAKISDNSAIASIIDNDAPAGVPVVSINDFVVDEASKEATFVITLNKPSTSVVSMNYATQNGSAVGGSDFTATSGSLNFAPGETAKTVKVTLVNDIVTEASEAFNLVLSAVTNATTLDPNGTAIIAENDAPKVLVSNISVEDIVVGESQVYADFLVRLDAPNTGTVTVNYATDANTAAANVDYSHLVGSLTFAAGEMVKTVRVTLADDAAVEKVENFRLVLSAPSANAKISDNSAIASIIDNDAPAGVPVVSINDFVVDEASKEATFVITLNKPSTSVVSMNYATQNGSAVGGSDFTATSGSLNFAPGETAKTVKVTLVNDIVTEASEAFNLVLSAVTNATTLDPNGTAIIAENDAPKVLVSNISVEDIVVGESQVYADFLVRLDAPNTGTVTVNYATDANTAAANVDYSHLVGSLTFAAGEMVKTVRVTLADDAAVEKVENFRLVLSAPSANAKISDNSAIASIIDNDAPAGTPVAGITDAIVDEANQTVTVTILLNKPSASEVSLNVAGQNVTALDGSDFRSFPFGKISFAPGETAKTVTFGLLNDAVAENAELFDVVLSSPVGATLGDALAHVVIATNDAAPVAAPVLNVANAATVENKGYVDFLVTLSAPGTNRVTVNYATAANTAAANVDYSHLVGSLTFAPWEMVKTVRVTLNDDTTAEALENFTLKLSGAVNATIGNAAATASIVDNDSPAPAAPIVINGTAGNDVLKGTQFADSLTGDNGNDVLDGDNGNDIMAGGAGNDIYIVENTGDTYTEAVNNGTDLVVSYLTTLTLGANVENLQLAGTAVTGIGNTLANSITGNTAANVINGALGADKMTGDNGNDTYIVDNIGDTIVEGLGFGTDSVQSSVTYTLAANVENLTLTGTVVLMAMATVSIMSSRVTAQPIR